MAALRGLTVASRRESLAASLKKLGLVTGRGRESSLLKLCHAGRLVGGLSVSLQATPDEVIGPLAHALGGAALALRVLDVRTGRPMVLEVQSGELREKWELADVSALVHNLNDLFRGDEAVRAIVELGEWEDMLQLWCLPRATLRALLDRRVLDDARNAPALVRLLERGAGSD